jgi:hypothetical protein
MSAVWLFGLDTNRLVIKQPIEAPEIHVDGGDIGKRIAALEARVGKLEIGDRDRR